MKILLVSCLLAGILLTLIISLDLAMGVSIKGIILKAINPFKVMESAEYIILSLFILFFFIDSIGAYLNKKKQNNPPSN